MTRQGSLRRQRDRVTACGLPRHGQVPRFLAGAALTVLLGTPSWAALTVPGRAEQNPGCPPLSPIAKRYVDRKTVCRRARQEMLHSFKTGKDPDWGNVLRDSIPAKPPGRHRPTKHDHHATLGHDSRPKP